jgi:small ubiquitin-related modifier
MYDSGLCLVDAIVSPLFSFVFVFHSQTGEITFFKIKKSTRMQKVFDAYAQRIGIHPRSLRFLLEDGENIGPYQTPKMLELDDQDQIFCLNELVSVCVCYANTSCVKLLYEWCSTHTHTWRRFPFSCLLSISMG